MKRFGQFCLFFLSKWLHLPCTIQNEIKTEAVRAIYVYNVYVPNKKAIDIG